MPHKCGVVLGQAVGALLMSHLRGGNKTLLGYKAGEPTVAHDEMVRWPRTWDTPNDPATATVAGGKPLRPVSRES